MLNYVAHGQRERDGGLHYACARALHARNFPLRVPRPCACALSTHCTHAIFHCEAQRLVVEASSNAQTPAIFLFTRLCTFSLRTYAFTRLRAAAELSRMGLRWLARRYAIFWAELSWVQAWSELVYVDFSCLPLGGDVGELNHMYSTPS